MRPPLFLFSAVLTMSCVSENVVAKSDRLVEEGKQVGKAGDQAAAIESFTLAIEQNPRNVDAYIARANAHVRIGDHAANPLPETLLAIDDYTRAIQIFPAHHKAYYNRALAFAAISRYREAVQDFRYLADAGPLQAEANYQLGLILSEKYEGRERDALAHFEHYLALGGADPSVRSRVESLRNKLAEPGLQEEGLEEEKKAGLILKNARDRYAADDQVGAWKAIAQLMREYPNSRAARFEAPKITSGWTPPK